MDTKKINRLFLKTLQKLPKSHALRLGYPLKHFQSLDNIGHLYMYHQLFL